MPRKAKAEKKGKSELPTIETVQPKLLVEEAQPEINIGLVGHVDHGKTTLVKALSGKWTDTHSEEIKRGITIRLGYADATFYKCPDCQPPDCWSTSEICPICQKKGTAQRKVSFVDAPGHESLMATMLSGATIMDGALLLISANERCPQPQTREHVQALEIVGIKNIIIVQNKIDILSRDEVIKNYNEIKNFIKGTNIANAPIIPISAMQGINIDALIDAIQTFIPSNPRDDTKDPLMFVARSFDINKPSTEINLLKGGVLGGALKQGKLKVGDEIEIKPGRELQEKNKKVYKPLKTKIVALITGSKNVDEVKPGGSFGLQTMLDPSIVKSDSLTGAVVGHPGKLPPLWTEFVLEINLLHRVVGSERELTVEPIKIGEILMLNVNSAATVATVTKLGKNVISCVLTFPVCAEQNSRATISRRIDNRFRLIGFGLIKQ